MVLNLNHLHANLSPVLSEFEITDNSNDDRSIVREINSIIGSETWPTCYSQRGESKVIHLALKGCISREHDTYTNGKNLAQANLKKK